MQRAGVLPVSTMWSKFLWSISKRPPGRTQRSKWRSACLWSAWSPVGSIKWANEFPRQMTASNPPLRWCSMSSDNVTQLASSITAQELTNSSLCLFFSGSLSSNLLTPIVKGLFLPPPPSLLQSILEHFVGGVNWSDFKTLFQQHDGVNPEK